MKGFCPQCYQYTIHSRKCDEYWRIKCDSCDFTTGFYKKHKDAVKEYEDAVYSNPLAIHPPRNHKQNKN